MPDGLLLSDWTTPQPFVLPDLGPGLEAPLREQLETALRQIAADPAVKALVLYSFGEACGYGSRATGNARPDSDLDLLVVERTPQLEPEAKVASWWRHFQPLQSLPLPVACDQRSGPPGPGAGGAALIR
jgi:predicted nucleotidyltransferase